MSGAAPPNPPIGLNARRKDNIFLSHKLRVLFSKTCKYVTLRYQVSVDSGTPTSEIRLHTMSLLLVLFMPSSLLIITLKFFEMPRRRIWDTYRHTEVSDLRSSVVSLW